MSQNAPAAQQTKAAAVLTAKSLFEREDVKKKMAELLGKKSVGFIASVLQVASQSALLKKASPASIYGAAMIAATLDLPINQNLGLAWIVPYRGDAQFQMGYRGFVQLAQRTGEYKSINVTEVYKNQFKSFDPLDEKLEADFSIEGEGEVAGYVGRFIMHNGFTKTVWWSAAKVEKHARKYSQSYGSVWAKNFDEMAKKTVLKNMLSKWGMLSVEMQTAVTSDQAVAKDADDLSNVSYPDNDTVDGQAKEVPDEATFEKIKEGVSLKLTTTEASAEQYDLTGEQLTILQGIEQFANSEKPAEKKAEKPAK